LTLLLDTCVLSEASRPKQSAAVQQWLSNQQQSLLYISALTIGELLYGMRRLGDGRKKIALEHWILTVLEDFDGRILALDEIVAARWGQLRADRPNAQVIDAQIAATALVHGFTVVTRNVKDFAFPGLAVFNPWRA
jgi:toxin FitB